MTDNPATFHTNGMFNVVISFYSYYQQLVGTTKTE